MTDLLLVNPPSSAVENNPMPFGLAYLGAYIEERGFSVKMIDLTIDRMSEEEAADLIIKENPKYVGITCCSVHVDFVNRLSKRLKGGSKKIKILVGGAHPTALPRESAEEMKDVDIFLIGEGEITLHDIIKGTPISKVKGVAYMNNGRFKMTPPRPLIEDLDELPFPARHLLPDMSRYRLSFSWEGRRPSATMFTSRGCPFNCIYCASKVMWRRRIRFMSAERVLEEIGMLVNDYGIKEILFYDDHFTLNKERLRKICEGIIDRKYDLTWCCLSRVDSIDMETARLMKRSGCHMINFGVESGSQTILDSMEKNVKVETIKKAFSVCRKSGINTKASFIFGAPKETKKTIRETVDFIKIIQPDYVWFFIMTPLPGTKLYAMCKEAGLASTDWSRYDQTTYNQFYGTDLKYSDLREAVSTAYKEYYLRPKFMVSQLFRLNRRKVKSYYAVLKNSLAVSRYVTRGRGKE